MSQLPIAELPIGLASMRSKLPMPVAKLPIGFASSDDCLGTILSILGQLHYFEDNYAKHGMDFLLVVF